VVEVDKTPMLKQ